MELEIENRALRLQSESSKRFKVLKLTKINLCSHDTVQQVQLYFEQVVADMQSVSETPETDP